MTDLPRSVFDAFYSRPGHREAGERQFRRLDKRNLLQGGCYEDLTGIIVDSVCKFGDATTTSHAVVTGNFDSAYTVDVTSTRPGGPPLAGHLPVAATYMTIQSTRLGPCAAGQWPVDIIMANGRTMNILDMPKPGMPPRRPQ
jgi:hypothetical protein